MSKPTLRALLVVDVQNDFCPGAADGSGSARGRIEGAAGRPDGALAVPGGNEIVPVANRMMPAFDLVVATQDWHPADHGSFASNHEGKRPGDVVDLNGLDQILWPDHCVQGAAGAEFHPDLDLSRVAKTFRKGTDAAVDSYSAFFDNARRRSTGLGDYLRARGATDVYVCGLATDYCVKFSCLDAVELGFGTHVVEDACRGVDLNPGDVDRAFEEMKAAGVVIVRSDIVMGDAVP